MKKMNLEKYLAAAMLSGVISAGSGCGNINDPKFGPVTGYDKVMPAETVKEMWDNSYQLKETLVVDTGEEKLMLRGVCSGTMLYDNKSKKNHFLTAEHCLPPEGDTYLLEVASDEEILRYHQWKERGFENKLPAMVLEDSHSNKYILERNDLSYPEGGIIAVKIVEKGITVDGYNAEAVNKDALQDLALLKLPVGHLKHYEGKLARDAGVGDLVAGVTYPGVNFKVLFNGFVAGKDGDEVSESFGFSSYSVFNGHIFFGSSGGGVYAFDGNTPVLASIVQVKYNSDGLEGMAPVLQVRKFIQKTELKDELID